MTAHVATRTAFISAPAEEWARFTTGLVRTMYTHANVKQQQAESKWARRAKCTVRSRASARAAVSGESRAREW
eukprot:4956973-Pleurochrysis_carterae.AAC.1